MVRVVSIWILLVWNCGFTYAQSVSLEELKSTIKGVYTIQELVDNLEESHDIILVYNAALIPTKSTITIDNGWSVGQIIETVAQKHQLSYVIKEKRIYFSKKENAVHVQGRVFDIESGEYLTSVIVEDLDSDQYTFTNEYGFFSLTLPSSHRLGISHIGYVSDTLDATSWSKKNYYLKSNLRIQLVVIEDSHADLDDVNTSARLLSSDTWSIIESEILDDNIDDIIRKQSSVQSGSEGQTGFFVRGGTPDQNLILIDNMHIYEASHTFGLNSIFIKQALKQIELNAEGMPARYGDRISAVLNATLKAGNKETFGGSLSASLHETLLQFDGPLVESGNTTINLAGRKSIHGLYIAPIIKSFTKYRDGNIDYYDFYGKLNHRLSNTASTSLTIYSGSDLFSLQSLEKINNFDDSYTVDVRSKLKWSNRLVSFNYDNVFSNRMHFHLDAGLLDYRQISTGYFGYKSETDFDSYQTIVHSGNKDRKASFFIDYYVDNQHRIKLGGEYLLQNMNPSLTQVDTLVDTEFINNEATKYRSQSYSMYLEDTYTPTSKLTLYAGLRYTRYFNTIVYHGWQPRFKILYKPWNDKLTIKGSYAYNTQFSHLLVNSGLGLPSDLWVPSNKDILPQKSHNLDASVKYNATKNLSFDVSVFSKNLSNVIEYDEGVKIYLIDFLSKDPNLFFDKDKKWESYVNQGKGRAYGVSLGSNYSSELFAFWMNYTYARDKRLFEKLNNGKEFRFRYDRPHDINIGFWYKLNDKWSITSRFVYTSGNTFSLSIEEYDSVLGITLSTSDIRNNFRMPAYHRLDFSAKYTRHMENKSVFDLILGINNVYNQRNPHYIFVYSDPSNNKSSLRKVSLFPILPKIKVSYSF